MKTALEQNREDQALGAAWRRCRELCSEALYLDWSPDGYQAHGDWTDDEKFHKTPTEALTALAEALEAQ